MGKITALISSNEGKIWAAKVLLPTKKVLKRPLNLLYPLKCDSGREIETTQDGEQLKESEEITSSTLRPTRAAATRARGQMQRLLSSDKGSFSWLGSVAEFPRTWTGNWKLTRRPGLKPEGLATQKKLTLEKRAAEVLDWAFPPLSHYSVLKRCLKLIFSSNLTG